MAGELTIENFMEERTAPPPGSAAPGNLYVDKATQTIWLGVTTEEDTDGAILLSDILTTINAINDSYLASREYTDQRIATRAPTVHTHTSSQITDFNAAVGSIIESNAVSPFPPKSVIMYSGLAGNIGSGVWVGWAICNGANGTPDLRNRFIMAGGGAIAYGAGGNKGLVTPAGAGDHKHTIDAHVLLETEIPSHLHGVDITSAGESVDHTHSINITANTNEKGSHDHSYTRPGSGARWAAGSNGGASESVNTGADGLHTHSVTISGNTGGRNVGHKIGRAHV